MKTLKIAAPLFALAAMAALAACDTTAPATPEPTPGPIAQSNALNGVYNLRSSGCGDIASNTALTIDGGRFIFPQATCTVANSEQKGNKTQVTLSCAGITTGGNRIVDLQIREGMLRMTEDQTSVNYYQCERAVASSNTQPAL